MPVTEFGVIVALTLVNAFFSGAEIAIISARKGRLEELAHAKHRGARAALELRRMPERFLATVQVGITVVGATAGAFGGAVLERPVAAVLNRHVLEPLGLSAWADGVALALVVAVISVLSIVIGELVPKSLALRSSERFALIASRPLLLLSRAASPVVWSLSSASNLILKPFSDTTSFTETRVSRDELRAMVQEAASEGAVNPGAADIASRALELDAVRVRAVMVPRVECVSLQASAPPEAVRDTLCSAPHRRYLVMGEGPDHVLGYVTATDVYRSLLEGELTLSSALREVPTFFENQSALSVLRSLQDAKAPMGVVVDELGSLLGLVTVEDIAEELMGDILAENDKSADPLRPAGANAYLVEAGIPLHELNRRLKLELPTGPGWSTLSGLVTTLLGRIPEVGATVNLAPGVTGRVLEASPRRVRRLRLELASSDA
jgi:putative hemolysin